MEETALQLAIMDAVNKSMDSDGSIGRNAVNGLLMILKPQENAGYTLDEVKRRIQELTAEFDTLFEIPNTISQKPPVKESCAGPRNGENRCPRH